MQNTNQTRLFVGQPRFTFDFIEKSASEQDESSSSVSTKRKLPELFLEDLVPTNTKIRSLQPKTILEKDDSVLGELNRLIKESRADLGGHDGHGNYSTDDNSNQSSESSPRGEQKIISTLDIVPLRENVAMTNLKAAEAAALLKNLGHVKSLRSDKPLKGIIDGLEKVEGSEEVNIIMETNFDMSKFVDLKSVEIFGYMKLLSQAKILKTKNMYCLVMDSNFEMYDKINSIEDLISYLNDCLKSSFVSYETKKIMKGNKKLFERFQRERAESGEDLLLVYLSKTPKSLGKSVSNVSTNVPSSMSRTLSQRSEENLSQKELEVKKNDDIKGTLASLSKNNEELQKNINEMKEKALKMLQQRRLAQQKMQKA